MRSIELNAFTNIYCFSTLAKIPGMSKYYNMNFYDKCKSTGITTKSDQLMDGFTLRGGIMADEMGLGKTISMIALILCNPRKKVLNPISKKNEFEITHKNKTFIETKATLVICAPHLVAQWAKEIKSKSKLSVLKISSFTNVKSASYNDFINNVIIVPYTLLTKSKPYLNTVSRCMPDSIDIFNSYPVFQYVGWHRIIADEAHEMNDKTIRTFSSLSSNYRWYVTGTPFPQKEQSFLRACYFLDLQVKTKENNTFKTSLINYDLLKEQKDSKYYLYLLWESFKQCAFWKNSKLDVESQTNIPLLTEDVNYIDLTPVEQALYDVAGSLYSNTSIQRQICSYPLNSSLIPNDGVFLKLYELPVLFICQHHNILTEKVYSIAKIQRQIIGSENNRKNLDPLNDKKQLAEIDRNIQNLKKSECKEIGYLSENICYLSSFSSLLPSGETYCCVICNDIVSMSSCRTKCHHIFCSHCICKFIIDNHCCPTCHTSLNFDELQFYGTNDLSEMKNDILEENADNYSVFSNLPDELINSSIIDVISAVYGSKIAAVSDYLLSVVKDKHQIRKVIVFSQYDKVLTALHESLIQIDKSIFENQIISCKGNIHVRNKKIASFNSLDRDSPRIIMLSLLNSASGTQLEVASHVILLDPVVGTREEARAIDSQAIARSHRIGQNSTVEAVRFIAMSTIEQKDYENAYGTRSRIKSARK